MKLIDYQLKYPKYFLGAIVVIVALLVSLAVQLQLNSSLSALIPDDGEFNSNSRLVEVAFDQGDVLEFIITPDDTTILDNAVRYVDDEQVAEYVDELQVLLAQSQYYKSATGLQIAENTARFFVEVRTPDRVGGDKDVKEELEFYASQISPPPGIEVQLTGLPLLIDRISSLLIQDNLTTIILTIIFIVIFLYWYFKSLRFVLAVIISPLISLIALAAAMVMLDIAITIPLAAVGVLVLGLGVDYSIHIAIHYKYERKEGHAHAQALRNVIKELMIPITASFLTTLSGFAALLFGVSPSTQDQGAVLSIAIILIYSVSFTVFPILLTLLVKNEPIRENKTFGKIKLGLANLAVYQAKHPWLVIAIVGVITIVMVGGMTQVEFNTSNSNWIPEADPLSVSFREDAYAFGDNDAIIILLESTEGDLRNVQTARDIKELQARLEQIPNIDRITSAYTDVSYDRAELYNSLTYEQNELFNEDYTVSFIRIDTGNTEDDAAGKSAVLREIRTAVDNNPIYFAETTFFGDVVRFEELGDSLQADAASTTMAGILLVFLIASIIYASVAVGLIALIPIIIGLIWAIGLMGYLGVPFTSLSTGIVSLVLGIGIDFSIHLVDGIKRYLKKLYSLEESLRNTLISSGTSILLSSMTTFIGFMALSFSQLLGTRRLGWSLAIAVFAVFVVAVATVPAIMKLTQKNTHKKVKKHV